MIIENCPSNLSQGFHTYSPSAQRALFAGKPVSHVLPYEKADLPLLTNENIGRISLSGVQSKLSLNYGEDLKLHYTSDGEQGHYILKPAPTSTHLFNKEFCPANENLTMQIASQVFRIPTAANGLCFYMDDKAAYFTKRFDYDASGNKLPQEDFASLGGFTKANGGSDYKYKNSSYEECAQIIKKYVKAPLVEVLKFFNLVIFNFLFLNDDAHLKNFALIKQGDEYRLAPAFDLINTSLHLGRPGIFALEKGLFKEGMSLSDVRWVQRADFEEFGKRIGLPEKAVNSSLDFFTAEHQEVKNLIDRSYLNRELKSSYFEGYSFRREMIK